jgi:hypothetical protein
MPYISGPPDQTINPLMTGYTSHQNRPSHTEPNQKTGKSSKKKFNRRNSGFSDQSGKRSLDPSYQLNKNSVLAEQRIPEHPSGNWNKLRHNIAKTSLAVGPETPSIDFSVSAVPSSVHNSHIPPKSSHSTSAERFPQLDELQSGSPTDIPNDFQVKSNHIGKLATNVTDLWVGRIPHGWSVDTVKKLFESKIGRGVFVEELRSSKFGYLFATVKCQTTEHARKALALHKHRLTDDPNNTRYLHVEVSARHWNIDQREHIAYGNLARQGRGSTVGSRRQSLAKSHSHIQTRGSEGLGNYSERGEHGQFQKHRMDQTTVQYKPHGAALASGDSQESIKTSNVNTSVSHQDVVKTTPPPKIVVDTGNNELGVSSKNSPIKLDNMSNSVIFPNVEEAENAASTASSPSTVVADPVCTTQEEQNSPRKVTSPAKFEVVDSDRVAKFEKDSDSTPVSPVDGKPRKKPLVSPKAVLPLIPKIPDFKISSTGSQEVLSKLPADFKAPIDYQQRASEEKMEQRVASTVKGAHSVRITDSNSGPEMPTEPSPTEPLDLNAHVVSNIGSEVPEKATEPESVPTPVNTVNDVTKADIVGPLITESTKIPAMTDTSTKPIHDSEVAAVTGIKSENTSENASELLGNPKSQSEQVQRSLNPFAQMKALEKQRQLEAKKRKIQKKKENKKGKKATSLTKVDQSDAKCDISSGHTSEHEKEDVSVGPLSPTMAEQGEKEVTNNEEQVKLPNSALEPVSVTNPPSTPEITPITDVTEHHNTVLEVFNNQTRSSEPLTSSECHDGPANPTELPAGSNGGSNLVTALPTQKPKKNKKKKAKSKSSVKKFAGLSDVKFAQNFSSDKSSDTEEEKTPFPTYHFNEALNLEGVKKFEDPNNPGYTRYGFPLSNLVVNQSSFSKDEVLFSRYAVPKMMPKQMAKEQEENHPQSNSPVRWADTPARSRSDTGESWTPLSGHRRDRRPFRQPPNTPNGHVPQQKQVDDALGNLHDRLMAHNSVHAVGGSPESRGLPLQSRA